MISLTGRIGHARLMRIAGIADAEWPVGAFDIECLPEAGFSGTDGASGDLPYRAGITP